MTRLVFERDLISYELTDIFDTLAQYPEAAAVVTYIDLSLCVRSVYTSHLTQLTTCINLSTLILSGSKRSDLLFTHSLPLLKSLDFSKSTLSDSLVQSTATHCNSLIALNLQGCSALSSHAVISVSRGCHSLTCLNLARCEKMTDNTLLALSHGCSLLSILDLKRNHRITDKGIRALSQGCPALSTLHLEKCKKITANGLRDLSAQLPRCQTNTD